MLFRSAKGPCSNKLGASSEELVSDDTLAGHLAKCDAQVRYLGLQPDGILLNQGEFISQHIHLNLAFVLTNHSNARFLEKMYSIVARI